jgi:hypothetical protein
LTREAITVTAVEEILGKNLGGRRLLRHPDIYQSLVRLAEEATGDIWESAYRLLALQRGPFPWKFTWSQKRLPPSKEVKRGMKELRFDHNPFGPERAELDRELREYLVRPAFWEKVSGSRSILAFGPPGSGKTATALGLAHDCQFPPATPREEKTFAIYHVPRFLGLANVGGPSQLDQIALTLSEALLQTLIEDPLLLLEQKTESKQAKHAKYAIARLLLFCIGLGSPETVLWELKRTQQELLVARSIEVLPKAPFQKPMMAELNSLMRKITEEDRPDELDLREWIGRARPARYDRTYVLIDLGFEFNESVPPYEYLYETVHALLEDSIHFERYNLYLKVFLPEVLYELGRDDWPVDTFELAWEERDLRQMLKDRLAHAGQTSLAEIYRDPANSLPDPDGQLIEAADGLPRDLIRLGNEMLMQVDSAPLRPEHLPSRSKRQ